MKPSGGAGPDMGSGFMNGGMPKWSRRRLTSLVSVMKAFIFMEPWHLGQIRGSSSKTRFIRAAQDLEAFFFCSGWAGKMAPVSWARASFLSSPPWPDGYSGQKI